MGTTYKQSGVDIEAGDALVERIKPYAARTTRPEVKGGVGGFGGLFALPPGKYKEPVLVAGTDGVGTKLKVAFMAGRHSTIGIDLVAMSVNDVLVQGAEPLFFLDYFACGKLERGVATEVVKGIARTRHPDHAEGAPRRHRRLWGLSEGCGHHQGSASRGILPEAPTSATVRNGGDVAV